MTDQERASELQRARDNAAHARAGTQRAGYGNGGIAAPWFQAELVKHYDQELAHVEAQARERDDRSRRDERDRGVDRRAGERGTQR